MKKSFCIGLLMMLCATLAQAQQKVYIQLNDTTIERYVWDVVDITFQSDDYELESAAPSATDAVDLGLSVKWAPINLTATTNNPDYEGVTFTHFGWGDVTGINQTDNLRYFPVTHPTANIVNDSSRDIAQKLWGDKWRLPTDKEMQDLIDKCEWTWKQDEEGNWGYLVEGNGNSIFLPAGGQRLLEEIQDAQEKGYYWTGVYNRQDDETAFSLSFNETGQPSLEALKRYYGLLIRPVYGDEGLEVVQSIEMLNCNEDYLSNYLDQANFRATYTLTGDADKAGEYGVLYGKSTVSLQYGGSCSKAVGSGSLDIGANTAVFSLTGLDEETSYKARPYVLVEGVPVYGDELSFRTNSRFPEPNYVDMGGSVYWAEWDVGASSPNDLGLYYGWGALTDEPGDYVTGFTGESIAGTNYDVAHVKWGDGWRMPTFADFEELFANCNTPVRETRMTSTGASISGYSLTSKKTGNTIFFPAAGYYSGTTSGEVNRYVYFWTAEIDPEGTLPILCRFAASGPVSRPNNLHIRSQIRAVYDKSITPSVTPKNAVDLGLSVKWAQYNLGAKKATDAGYYISWGDTGEPEDGNYSKTSHIHYHNGAYDDLGKDFNANGTYEWDAARKLLGSTWRVPTEKEMSELWTECTWTWTDNYNKSDVAGFIVKGPSGKSIFLPAAGWKTGKNGTLQQDGRYGSYWTSSLNLRNTDYGLNLQFSSALSHDDPNANPLPGVYREFGLSIRPVCP
jgi:hypothetical protein